MLDKQVSVVPVDTTFTLQITWLDTAGPKLLELTERCGQLDAAHLRQSYFLTLEVSEFDSQQLLTLNFRHR